MHFLETHRLRLQIRLPLGTGRTRRRFPHLGSLQNRGIQQGKQGAPSLMRFSEGSVASSLARRSSGVTFRRSLWMWSRFDASVPGFQFVERLNWLGWVQLPFGLGVDGISRFFVRLNSLLTPLCILASRGGIQSDQKTYYGLFLRREGIVHLVFMVTNRLGFYLAFEAVLIPMFLIIGRYGSRTRKIRAGYYFFLYTFFGSVWMLLALLRIYHELGTRDMNLLVHQVPNRPWERQTWLWRGLFVGFAVKIPMLPVHIWLPEAHVEAPTAGSVILAGILLKLGSYGMIRVLLGRFPLCSLYFGPRVYVLAMRAIVYTSRTAIRQTDMKRVIAYASVAHMNMTLVGAFSGNIQGLEGSLLQMISHGLVSGALFLCVGVLYDRHHTRLISYYGGRVQTMPRFVAFFRRFTRANIGLPGTSSFVGEFLILVGIYQTNSFVARVSATGMVLGGAYSLWLFNRVSYGTHKIEKESAGRSLDLGLGERLSLLSRAGLTLRLGVYPEIRLRDLHASVMALGFWEMITS